MLDLMFKQEGVHQATQSLKLRLGHGARPWGSTGGRYTATLAATLRALTNDIIARRISSRSPTEAPRSPTLQLMLQFSQSLRLHHHQRRLQAVVELGEER